MKTKLYRNPNIEVRVSSTIENSEPEYGIFATKKIKSGDILEECHFIPYNEYRNTIFNDYVFRYPKEKTSRRITNALVLGYGSMFNHSIPELNATWKTDLNNQIFIFSAIKDINPDEEIFIDYGNHYFKKRNTNNFQNQIIEITDSLTMTLNKLKSEVDVYRKYMNDEKIIEEIIGDKNG